MLLSSYDSQAFGPLFAVSDEGSAGRAVREAAYASAKARAFPGIDPLTLGVLLDGERMTSAGEVPIGPDEYAALNAAVAGRLLCTTNVGVRANARLAQPLPEFAVGTPDGRWLEEVVAGFAPFLHTPGGGPRPLTIRLVVRPEASLATLAEAVKQLEEARSAGRIGPSDLHRFSVLLAFDDEIDAARVRQITQVIRAAAYTGLTEVAIDGPLRAAARLRLSVQSLLNVLDVAELRELLREARTRKVRLVYRHQLDVESAARTIWTGLHAARSLGFAAGKYGLVPMTLGEQRRVVELLTRWTLGWVAIPAFYVDTPLVTDDDVFDPSECVYAARTWLTMVRDAGVTLVLFDCPDRITPRKLLRQEGAKDDPGVLTLADVDRILEHARSLGIAILWSGGITSRQAFDLAQRRVHGIFSTSSTAQKIAVSAPFAQDPRLPAENEPTEAGVRRIHGVVQGGYLSAALRERNGTLASSIESMTKKLLDAEKDAATADRALAALDGELVRGWQSLGARPPVAASTAAVPVPADAVRVFRGRRRSSLAPDQFVPKLGSLFMPFTVQMQRNYGLTAYLPAVLPRGRAAALPDEIALVFYRTQAAYHDAKTCVGGRAYSELHDLVFDMGASGSGFPERFADGVDANKPYHLFPGAVDWQGGSAQVYVGTRPATLAPEDFRRHIASGARRMQQFPGAIDAAILCASADWLICWVHAAEGTLAPIEAFRDIAEQVFAAAAVPLVLPHELTVPYAGFDIPPEGGFFNLQFPRN